MEIPFQISVPVMNPDGSKQTLVFKNEDILAVVKFNVSREEFLERAKKFIIEMYDPTKSEQKKFKEPFETATMYVVGLVGGQVRNEIIIVKNKPTEEVKS
jgi:hypothetical protein